MRQKKLHSDNMFTHLLPLSASTIWKSICRAIPFVREGYKCRIGYGQQVSVWFDRWVGDFPLYSLIPHPEEEDKSLMVAELISYLVIVKKKRTLIFVLNQNLILHLSYMLIKRKQSKVFDIEIIHYIISVHLDWSNLFSLIVSYKIFWLVRKKAQTFSEKKLYKNSHRSSYRRWSLQ